RSAKVKPLHATLARRALLRLDSMAAPDPHSMGVPRPEFPRLCPACLPRYPLQTILRQVLALLWQIYSRCFSLQNPFSAARASLRRWSSDEFEDGLAHGGQCRSRRRPVDSFFPAL